MRIVDQALDDPRVRELFEELARQINFDFRESGTANWFSNVAPSGVAVIDAAESAHPASALAHELLHIQTQLRGYRRLRFVASPSERGAFPSHLLTALDNELQHHRMFPDYVQRGFPSTRFYADNDGDVERYLWSELAADSTYRDLVVPFLSLIAPGGQLRESAKRKLKSSFFAKPSGSELREVHALFKAWRSQAGFDAEWVVKRVYCLADSNSKTWIGYGSEPDFPGNGFFVSVPFTIG